MHAGKELVRGNLMVRGTLICTRSIVQREVPGPKGVHPNRLPPIQQTHYITGGIGIVSELKETSNWKRRVG